ncbi:MAG: FecR domain-containing protein [Myxococcales bacterium]|nr:FecR domain-containing protein [Myxococcales bacterium]
MKPEALAHHLDASRDRLEPRWDDAREAHVQAGLPHRARLHRRRRVAAAIVAVALVGVVASLAVPRASQVRIEPIADARFQVVEQSKAREAYRVERGAVWFDVKPGRAVRVDAEEVEVEVLGTRFLVERVDARVHIVVDHGVVRAKWKGQLSTVKAGEEAWFPPREKQQKAIEPAPPPPVEVADPVEEPAPVSPPTPAPKNPRLLHPRTAEMIPSVSAQTWKELAQAGEFERAWEAMQKATPPRDEPAELLLAADVARLSRHPDQALAPLTRIIEQHRTDPRAPLAAFTLGRVLLDDLGRPREAAAAFEHVRTLAPDMPLAEDAFARQIEALFRAQAPEARALAEAFEKKYPTSARLRAVRHFGGLP